MMMCSICGKVHRIVGLDCAGEPMPSFDPQESAVQAILAEGLPIVETEPVSIQTILTERGARYGEFIDHAFIAQLLKAVMCGDLGTVGFLLLNPAGDTIQAERVMKALKEKWQTLAPDQREALDMNAHKVARILNGDPDYSDSWRDIAGYATLVADRLDKQV